MTPEVAPWKCLTCGSRLCDGPRELVCPSCGRTWSVRNGVPVFFEPPYYWGEVDEDSAWQLLHETRSGGWTRAVLDRFAADPTMLSGLLDWQRISWAPLLALDSTSVVLDVGCGHGAITHALARLAGEVYAVDAIPARVEFTRERLRQDGIANVRLAQATALDLPFLDGTFDAIVVNGVLEWVGEWTNSGAPARLQRDFLSTVARLLKPEGQLVIGIENRYGLAALRGAVDHSGRRFTSVMPRRLASAWLRMRGRRGYRLAGKSAREYRTYTYSKRGYASLLRSAGLPQQLFLWAEPGYNQPYALVPATRRLMHDFLRREFSAGGRYAAFTLKQRARLLLTRLGLTPPSDFVIIAQRAAEAPRVRLWRYVPGFAAARRNSTLLPVLSTAAFALKSVVIATDPAGKPSAVIKTSTGPGASARALERECINQKAVHALSASGRLSFHVPRVLSSFHVGRICGFAEAHVSGPSLANTLFDMRMGARVEFLRQALPACMRAAESIASLSGPEIQASPPPSVEPLADASVSSLLPRFAEASDIATEVMSRLDASPACIQHGDFGAENLYLDGDSLTVIDWADVIETRLTCFDRLSLLLSIVRFGGVSVDVANLEKPFARSFFGDGPWAELIATEIDRMGGGAVDWEYLIAFLVTRIRYYMGRSPHATVSTALDNSMLRLHTRWLEFALAHGSHFVGSKASPASVSADGRHPDAA